MSYEIHLRKNETGEVRILKKDYPFNEFWWREGNASCDCNRKDFFEEVDDTSEEESPCGSGAYTVVKAIVKGKIVYSEVDQTI